MRIYKRKTKTRFLKRERYVRWPSRKLKDVVKYDLMILKREWRKSSDNCEKVAYFCAYFVVKMFRAAKLKSSFYGIPFLCPTSHWNSWEYMGKSKLFCKTLSIRFTNILFCLIISNSKYCEITAFILMLLQYNDTRYKPIYW